MDDALINEKLFRYKLQSSAVQLYRRMGIEKRVGGLARCCTDFVTDLTFHVDEYGRCYVMGLRHCNSRSSCPVCSMAKQVESLEEIKAAISSARKFGYYVVLVTYTFRHGLADELCVIQSGFSMAKEMMYRDRGFRELIRSMGYVGRITDYEVQLCGENGYHPHTHDLEFFECDMDCDYVRNVYADYWSCFLEKVGLSCKKDIAVNVLDYKGIGDYVTKLSRELTLHLQTKESFGSSLSPFQCLKVYMEEDDYYYGSWFCDYVMNVKGKRFLGWSRGLRDRLEIMKKIKEEKNYDIDCLFVLNDRRQFKSLPISKWMEFLYAIQEGYEDQVYEELNRLSISYSKSEISVDFEKKSVN